MADASFLQTSFLGGEWSPYAQGRMDKETYRTALNRCYNSFPVEEGAWTRRPATMFAATTRNGAQALLRNFDFNQALPYSLEFTAGHMRMFSGLSLVLELPNAVGAISAANPAVVNVPQGHGFTTADQVQFSCTPQFPGSTNAGPAPLFNRQFVATVTDANNFSLTDPITGATIDGSTINIAGWNVIVARVVDFATPYTLAEIKAKQLRVVQDENIAIVLDGLNIPKVLQSVSGGTFIQPVGLNSACFQTFNFTTAQFVDGPYLDVPTDGTTLTPVGTGSPVTLNASSIASINGGRGFLSTDVGRPIRLFSEPPAWAVGTAYTKGQTVKYANVYWQALQSSTGSQPDTSVTNWAVTTTAAAWTWGTITTVASTTQIIATLAAADPYGVNAGGVLLNGVQPVLTWQLGVYSNTTGWPTGGTYHEGRFWLFGAQFNRADATMSNNGGTPETQSLRFNPTAIDGTVADNNGISIVLNATQMNSIFWMIPDHQGIVMGTQAGEWLIQASNLNDPLTPASVQAHPVTRYGCANVEPRRTGLSIAFVHRYQRKLMEYIADVYSGKFSGTNIALDAQHFTQTGIQEIAYVQERVPIIWSLMGDGSLKGMTYKRESPFGTQPANFFGWHQHALGSGRVVESIQAGPSPGGATDALVMVTNDTSTNIRYVEMMSPVFDEGSAITLANFVDAAVVPTFSAITGNNVIFYGLNYINGKTVTAFLGGVDAGDFIVSNGAITVPINAVGSLLTTAYLQSLASGSYGYLGTVLQVQGQGNGFYSPVGAALNYTYGTNYSLHSPQESQSVVFDWDKGRFYAMLQNSVGTITNMEVMNIATRAEIANVNITADEVAQAGGGSCTTLGYDGNIYYGTTDSAHLIGRFNTTSLASDINYADTHSLSAPAFVVPVRAGGTDYVLACGLNSGQSGGLSAAWYVIQMTNTTSGLPLAVNTADQHFDEGMVSLSGPNAFPVRGPAGVTAGGCSTAFGYGTAYVMVYGTINAGASFQIGVYRIIVSPLGAAKEKIGVINPAAVLGTWTAATITASLLFDETDGNLMVILTGSDATKRLAKISTKDASVLWSQPITTASNAVSSRVRGGRFSMIDGSGSPWTMKRFDTIAGTVDTSLTESAIGPQTYSTDDKAGQVVLNTNDINTVHWQTLGPNGGGGTLTPAVQYNAPCVIGFNYQSQGQLLRRVDPNESGARNGPALGKTRRTHQAAILLAQTQGIYFGTDFASSLHKADLKTYPGGTATLPLTTLYGGVYWTPIEDPYGFDGMISWVVKRPYPATVLAVEGFLHTQDR